MNICIDISVFRIRFYLQKKKHFAKFQYYKSILSKDIHLTQLPDLKNPNYIVNETFRFCKRHTCMENP